MKIQWTILVAMALGVLAGCASSPKTAKPARPPQLTYWEYRTLAGFDAEHSPEAGKLKQAGWTYAGTVAGGGNMAEDYGLASMRNGPAAISDGHTDKVAEHNIGRSADA